MNSDKNPLIDIVLYLMKKEGWELKQECNDIKKPNTK